MGGDRPLPRWSLASPPCASTSLRDSLGPGTLHCNACTWTHPSWSNKIHRNCMRTRKRLGGRTAAAAAAAAAKSPRSYPTLCDPTEAAYQAPPSWGSPGKNIGVGCHFVLQCMEVKSESEVAQACATLSDPMDCSLPGSFVQGIFQARVLEWGAIAFFRPACAV